VLVVLAEAGVLDGSHRPLARPPRRVVGRACCRGAYLRGAFLGGGSLVGPPTPHLELRVATRDGAAFLRYVAGREGATLGLAERSRHALAYAKGWETIETVLGAAGAVDAVLALEERSIVAAARSAANRLANADHANLVRASRAAGVQLDALRRLRSRGELQRLDDRLREAAELRLRHPTLSLRELAARAEPPATKAGMQRRLARLVDLADG
jgi:cell division protein WhiA